ncbi:YugN family protein [Paenibacillus sp. GCM10027626]|uniref:YugN family protein n=1 Tax=Paenibacillus sp. GCM10027626 TaxID=3273411 RepID=UPI003637B2F7
MLRLQTDLEGRQVCFGDVQDELCKHGYCLGSNWEYDRGSFDSILWQEAGETIYLRLPFYVTDGRLDKYDTSIVFQTPYVIKHIVNIGLDKDINSLLSTTGADQFQTPLDTDGHIRQKSKWEEAGEQAIQQVIGYLQ